MPLWSSAWCIEIGKHINSPIRNPYFSHSTFIYVIYIAYMAYIYRKEHSQVRISGRCVSSLHPQVTRSSRYPLMVDPQGQALDRSLVMSHLRSHGRLLNFFESPRHGSNKRSRVEFAKNQICVQESQYQKDV